MAELLAFLSTQAGVDLIVGCSLIVLIGACFIVHTMILEDY